MSNTEKSEIADVLDTYRGFAVWKLEGLSREDAVRPMVSSGTSLLGIVKHLVYVERYWFQAIISGHDIEAPWSDEDPDADFRIEDDESIADIIGMYETECAASRFVFDGLDSLDAEYLRRDTMLSAREILLHMIEEIARHVGHQDILRELIDGTTGVAPGVE